MNTTRVQPEESPRRPAGRSSRAGFTLVELLIAMLILAIGIMAILQMQFSSMGSAMISRDNANSSDLAQRMLDVMRTESVQWRNGSIGAQVATPAYNDLPVVSANTPLLATVEGAGWGWTSLLPNPVDSRLTTTGNTRYCAYGRGGYLEAGEVFTVQLAVVFPSANNAFPAAGCPNFNAADLDASMDPTDAASLQMDGYQVQFFGSQIFRRAYLGD